MRVGVWPAWFGAIERGAYVFVDGFAGSVDLCKCEQASTYRIVSSFLQLQLAACKQLDIAIV